MVSAPRQRMTKEEKARAKAGEAASDIWPDDLSKAAQKDTDARWTVKYSKAKTTKEGEEDTGLVDISVPHFGYKNHVSIDRKWRFIRGETGTNAARYDGHERSSVLDETNSSKAVWADTGYRSARNEAWLKAQGYRSHIHRKKPRGKPMARHIRRGNATRSAIRACVRLRERAHGSDHPLNRPNPCEGPHDHGQPELQLPPSHLPRATTGHSLTPPKFRKLPAYAGQNAALLPQIPPILTFTPAMRVTTTGARVKIHLESALFEVSIWLLRYLKILFFIHLLEQIHVQIFPRSPLAPRDVSKPCRTKHQRRVAIRECSHYSCSPPDFSDDPLQRIVSPNANPVLCQKPIIRQGLFHALPSQSATLDNFMSLSFFSTSVALCLADSRYSDA